MLQRARAGLATPWVRTVTILWIVQAVGELAFGLGLPFTPLYVQELGVSNPRDAGLWAGAMTTGFAIMMGLMAPVWGGIADRFGRRIMIQRALFGMVVVLGAVAFVTSPEQLFALRLLQGVLSGLGPAISTVVSLTVPRERLAATLGALQSSMFVGNATGPILGGIISDHYGYRAAFLVTAVLFLLVGILVTIFITEPVREKTAAAQQTASGPQAWRAFLGRPEILIVLGLIILIRLTTFAPNPILPLYIQGLVTDGAPVATYSGMILALTGVASTISALVIGILADRFGRRGILLLCLLAAACLSIPQALVTTVWQLLALRIGTGLALGGMTPVSQAVFTELTPPERRGIGFGILTTAGAIGLGIGPLSGSLVAGRFGNAAVFLAMAPLFLFGAISLLRFPSKVTAVATEPPLSQGECCEPCNIANPSGTPAE